MGPFWTSLLFTGDNYLLYPYTLNINYYVTHGAEYTTTKTTYTYELMNTVFFILCSDDILL